LKHGNNNKILTLTPQFTYFKRHRGINTNVSSNVDTTQDTCKSLVSMYPLYWVQLDVTWLQRPNHHILALPQLSTASFCMLQHRPIYVQCPYIHVCYIQSSSLDYIVAIVVLD